MSLIDLISLKDMGNEHEFMQVLHELPAMVLITDLKGEVLYMNKNVENEFGFKLDQKKGKPVWSLFVNHKKGKSYFDSWAERLNRDEVVTYQEETRFSNGKKKWLDVKLKKLKQANNSDIVLWTASDITILKKLEQDLEKRRARTEAIVESTIEGIFSTNKEGIILSANTAMEQIFYYPKAELVGMPLAKLIPALLDYSSESNMPVDINLMQKERKYEDSNRQIKGKKKNGSFFPILLSLNELPLKNEDLFTGLIVDLSESRRLENKILETAENERLKIGQELHDSVGQMLSAITLITQNLARKLKANSLPGVEELEEIIEMVKEADQETRHLAHGLAHIELENEGLLVALKRLCHRFQTLSKTNCSFECEPGIQIKDKMMALHIYRIVQEAVNNAVTHAKASRINVKLEREGSFIKLIVENNGDCFENSSVDMKVEGMGLNTMQYRVEILGGDFNIGSTGKGLTQVKCLIPVNE